MNDPNVYATEWELDTPSGLRGARVGAAAGATELGATVYELSAGSAISPYHLHHGNEELLVVLSGRPLLRTPDGTRRLEPGAVVAFPRGPDGAHRVANVDEEPARVLLVSTMHFPDVATHLATGATLAITGPAAGLAFPGGSDQPVIEALTTAMELDAAEDQRGLSTS